MIDSGFLEALLDGAEAKWLPLDEVGEVIRGNGLQKKDLEELGFPAIHYGQLYTKYSLAAHETCSFVAPEKADKLRTASNGDLLIATTSENDEDVLKPLAWHGGPVAISGDMMLFRHQQNVKYLAYCFLTQDFQRRKQKFITGTKVRRISKDNLGKLAVPIPCPDDPEKSLAIQNEIVRILDTFTELTAELTARQKQYSHYRDQLLTFEEGAVEWTPLGEIADIGTGSHDTKDALPDGDYTFYARGRKPLKLDVFDFDETAIITAGDGVGVGKVFHWVEGKYALHQRAYRIVPNGDVDARYIYHYLVAKFREYVQKTSVHSSVTSLRRPMFLKLPIPIPPRGDQARIVATLDKFDTLTQSITEGLPREIELREKQYRYYRDLLLDFPKPEAEGA